jgi:hypothetical protein
LKAVVQAIPIYIMGIFQLPIALSKELNQMMQHFWWSHMSKNSKIHWMSWSKMGRSKTKGGARFSGSCNLQQSFISKARLEANARPEFSGRQDS